MSIKHPWKLHIRFSLRVQCSVFQPVLGIFISVSKITICMHLTPDPPRKNWTLIEQTSQAPRRLKKIFYRKAVNAHFLFLVCWTSYTPVFTVYFVLLTSKPQNNVRVFFSNKDSEVEVDAGVMWRLHFPLGVKCQLKRSYKLWTLKKKNLLTGKERRPIRVHSFSSLFLIEVSRTGGAGPKMQETRFGVRNVNI